jgi:Arc/MetJ-type ribon-helix-helix transcriptional regulator
MEPLTAKVPESQKDRIEELAEKYEVSRSEIMRELLLLGQHAWERYPSQFPLDPEGQIDE